MSLAVTPYDRPPLSTLLREGTAVAHHAAEHSPFLLALAQGRVDRAGVAGLLARLLPVYEALEGAAAEIGPVALHGLHVPGLDRVPALRSDLAGLGVEACASPAAAAYAGRVQQVRDDLPRYLAHHYTRYLGDLSGGQVVGRAIRDSLGLDLAFFRFDDLRGPAVKRGYREALDALQWDEADRAAVVQEASEAFGHNQALASELEAHVLPVEPQS